VIEATVGLRLWDMLNALGPPRLITTVMRQTTVLFSWRKPIAQLVLLRNSNRFSIDFMNKLLLCFLVLCCSLCARAQGTFRNLDFGLTQVPSSTPPGSVPTTQALPFWSAYIGGVQQSSVFYNSESLGAEISLISPNTPGFVPFGKYMVYLSAALLPDGSSTSIAQTSQFPDSANALQFVASGTQFPSPNPFLEVTVNGMKIPLTQTSQAGLGLYNYQADISAFAGQTAELRFSALVINGGARGVNLGDIQFLVPEPAPASLLLIGSVIAWWKRAGRSELRKTKCYHFFS
jgi:hypothetical protein